MSTSSSCAATDITARRAQAFLFFHSESSSFMESIFGVAVGMYATRAARVATCDLATESGSGQAELRERNIFIFELARLRV